MATSSIFAKVKIDNKKDAKAFVDALEKSEQTAKTETLTPAYKFVTTKNDIHVIADANKRTSKK